MPSGLIEQSAETSRSVGFPKSVSPPAALTVTSSKNKPIVRFSQASLPQKKRPKGRWFVTAIIASLLGFIAVSLWNEFVHFQAYGELQGSLVTLSSSSPGRINSIHVVEGDWVEQGQLLAELDLRDLEIEQRRVKREMQIAISNLQVRLAEISSQNRRTQSEQIDRQIRYHQLLGEYHASQARLQELANTFETNQNLQDDNAVSNSELIASKAAYEGQKFQLEDLAGAVRAFEEASAQLPEIISQAELVAAEKTKIATLQAELDELNDLVLASEIRAPVTGRVLKRLAQPGEQLRASDPVMELVEAGTVQAVIYLPQDRAFVLSVGDEIQVVVKPLGERRTFQVKRVAAEVVPPPESLKANYRANRGLVRVYAIHAPTMEESDRSPPLQMDLTRWVGAELELPRFGFRAGQATHKNQFASQNSTPVARGVE